MRRCKARTFTQEEDCRRFSQACRGFRELQECAGPLYKLFTLKGSSALGASALVMSLNKKAFDALHEPKALEIVPLGRWSVLSSMP